MLSFPNCKINLGLNILRKRPDGYHDIETVFFPAPLKDIIEIVTAEEFSFTPTGIPVPGDPANNLCTKAYHLIKNDFPALPPVAMHLFKHIPMGAGLGGGSADGAFMLKLLDQNFQLGLGLEKLLEYAVLLGSDCPFFILNRPCLASGRGEVLAPIRLDLSAYSLVLVHPGVHISTAWAFSQIIPRLPERRISEIIQEPITNWSTKLMNDFEAPVLREYPNLATIKEKLYTQGALYASLTGSGSSFFGIFEKDSASCLSFEQEFQVLSLSSP
jgi:4-diphosphocytidyl-2-C-methyl-D-erythritol kinase